MPASHRHCCHNRQVCKVFGSVPTDSVRLMRKSVMHGLPFGRRRMPSLRIPVRAVGRPARTKVISCWRYAPNMHSDSADVSCHRRCGFYFNRLFTFTSTSNIECVTRMIWLLKANQPIGHFAQLCICHWDRKAFAIIDFAFMTQLYTIILCEWIPIIYEFFIFLHILLERIVFQPFLLRFLSHRATGG